MDIPLRPIYLFADSQLLFWKEQDVPFLESLRLQVRQERPSAAYIGASNDDMLDLYSLFEGAMEGVGIDECRMIRTFGGNLSAEDREFLQQADLVLLAGGDAERGWQLITQTGLNEILVQRYTQGAVLIGTSALLRALPARSVGCAGFIALDTLLRMPDFRAGERAWQLVWEAAEAVAPGGRLVVQTQHPDHYAVRSAREQDRAAFYAEELRFRSELGYPPFRRLCAISVGSREEAQARARATDCAAALRGIPGLIVYPPASVSPPGARARRVRFVIKGPAELPRLLAPALAPFLGRRRGSAGVVEVEMDPQTSV